MAKRVLKIAGMVLLAVVLVVAAYLAYVFGTSYRVEDNQQLEVQHVGGGQAQEPIAGVDYSIMSYNVGFGAHSSDFSFFMDGGTESRAWSADAVRENVEGAAHAIDGADPDIVLVQEIDVDGTRSHHVDEVQLLTEALPQYVDAVYAQNYDSPYLMFPPLSPHGANKSGIYTLSKFGITSALRRSLPVEDGVKSIVDLDRCYSVSRIPVAGADGRELLVYNLHLSAYTTDGKIAEDQLRMLFDDMQKAREAGAWTIAGGDFNKDLLGNSGDVFGVSAEGYTWAQPLPEGSIPEGFQLVAPFDADDPVASCRSVERPFDDAIFRVTVDGFIVSDDVQVLDATVLDEGYRYSDHNPVLMRFRLAG